MKTIYVWTSDYRSYSSEPISTQETIAVEVPDDFQAGLSTYDPATGEWIPDEVTEQADDPVADAEVKRSGLLFQIDQKTKDWTIELLLGDISDDDKALLSQWMAYKKALKALDLSTASDIDWPELEDFAPQSNAS